MIVENNFMDIKLARINNKNMLLRIAQASQTIRQLSDGSYVNDEGKKVNSDGFPVDSTGKIIPENESGQNQGKVQQPASQQPANNTSSDAYAIFIQRQQLQQFQQQPWLINLFYAYQPQPSTRLENEIAGAVRRATGTSSDRIREHLANALSRIEAPKVTSLRDKAINEYGRWNEAVTSELARTQGQAESQKSQDANKAYDALLQWEEGTDDPSWLFLTNEVSKAALKQAQMKIVREIEREGSGILNSSPLSFTEVATDPVSYFNALMEQGYVRSIQSKGGSLPFDVIMGWAEALNEAQRMAPQFQRFQGIADQASERQGLQTDMRGIRNQGALDRARAAEQRRMQRRRTR